MGTKEVIGAEHSLAMSGPRTSTSDEELARLCRDLGRNDAFAELFVRYRKTIFLFCHAFFEDSQAAEDATQETFLRAFRSLASFQGGEFGGWVKRIARNVCIDEWRHRRLDIASEDLENGKLLGGQDSGAEARLLAARSLGEIQRLPAHQRQCLELLIEGCSYREIADTTGLDLKSVKSHIQNGRRMVWQRVKGSLRVDERSREAISSAASVPPGAAGT